MSACQESGHAFAIVAGDGIEGSADIEFSIGSAGDGVDAVAGNLARRKIGIDHAIENRDDADQEFVFLKQLKIARKYDRPVTIHCRRAWGRLIELLDQFGEIPRGMLIHCFGGSAEVATELVKRGAYISFSGSITRPNARKAGPAIRAVPADRILIETDAPDILPHNVDAASSRVVENPLLNEPANLRYVLTKAAELRGMTEEALAEITFRNAERFFCRTGNPARYP